MSARLEKRKHGIALVDNGVRLAPFGYVRRGVLRMKSEGDYLALTPADLRRLADEIESLRAFEDVVGSSPASNTLDRDKFPPLRA